MTSAPRPSPPSRPRGMSTTGFSVAHVLAATIPVAALQLIYGLTVVSWTWERYPAPGMVGGAWALLLLTIGATALAVLRRGDGLPGWMFVVLLIAIAAVVSADLIAVWPLHNMGSSLSAGVCVGSALLLAVTSRPAREIIASTTVLGVVLLVAILVNTPLTFETAPIQLIALALTVTPPLIGVFTVTTFQRFLATELDRVLVQSTVTAPQFTLGMLASEELARLDLAAEHLLESVANGTQPLPLDPETASEAASLATELRLHLIENRRETWLYHAITESDHLGRSVTLSDPHALAGQLTPPQRDGLFSAVWMLVTDRPKLTPSVSVVFGEAVMHAPDLPFGAICVPITVTVDGVPPNRVDPSVWTSIAKVGLFSHTVNTSTIQIEIRCIVESPGQQ